MDIFEGLCVICSENTLVLSGKDKQKFVELLKEHYFDVNHINDNKFLLQFKEKRSEKSICLSCAYIINCYVNVRNNFIETKGKPETKCSICRIESNLTNGTNKLIEDALSILKNVNKSKKIPKLSLICLDCCFCIISWNKVKDIILQYLQSENGEIINMKKRKLSGTEDLELEDQFAVPISPLRSSRRTRSRSVTVTESNQTFLKDSPKRNARPDKKKIKTVNNDSFPLDTKLRHLSNVNREILSNDIHLNNKVTNKVMSDEKMMYHIAYISCDSDNTSKNDTPTTLRKFRSQSVSSDGLQTKNNKRKTEMAAEKSNKKIKNAATKNNFEDDSVAENNVKTTRKLRKSVEIKKRNNETPAKSKSKVNKKTKNTDIIEISEGESEENTSPVRTSSRINKGKPPKKDEIEEESTSPVRTSSRTNKGKLRTYENENIKMKHPCSKCQKSFAKKYNSYLHELEHDASYSPVVKLTREELNPINSSKIPDEISTDVDTLVKQVVNDTILQLENEISTNIINQVVDDTLSEIENKIGEDETQLKEQESDKTENSNNENDNHENEISTEDSEENKKTETESPDCENSNENNSKDKEEEEDGENSDEVSAENEKITNGIENESKNDEIDSKEAEKNSNNNDTNESNNKETEENSNDCEPDELNNKETENNSDNESKNEEITANNETNDCKNEETEDISDDDATEIENNESKENIDENAAKEPADDENQENSSNNKIVDDDNSSNDSNRDLNESMNTQNDDGSTLNLCVENDDDTPTESNKENSEISETDKEKENNIDDNHTNTNDETKSQNATNNGLKSDVESEKKLNINEEVQNSKTDKYENVESLLEDLEA